MYIRFFKFLLNIGFSEEEVQKGLQSNVFSHSVGEDSIHVKYIFTPNESDIFKSHQLLWNKNTEPVFIAVTEDKSHLINAKEKPDEQRPLKNSICIRSFDYGVNTKGFENIDQELISKTNIDSAYFFDFVSKKQRKSNKTVDKDLLLNLLQLKSDLVQGGNNQIVHLLILRCLFIKYLEDRGIFDKHYLLNILETGNPKKLTSAFDQVARINGDIFKYDTEFEPSQIEGHYLHQLALFFSSDYRSSQQSLFPYQFDNIPIQLISHVYEAFLKSTTKKGDGVYYTPSFLVDFMLSQSFEKKLKLNPKATILDPAVGSGAFLVQAFQMIQKAHGRKMSYEEKKEILKTQLFGIDIDRNALQIAAFSLYLALLEQESSNFIKEKIEQENPILPSLIGETLVSGNTILEDIFSGKCFDCIASNPPWGSVPTEETNEVYINERAAIDNKNGNYPEYEDVADYERSQAFLTRVAKWGDDTTIYVMVVKNSIFLNDKTFNFRQYILNKYQVNTFYELSHYNEILFKKTIIGEVHGEKVELGASEPCVILVFQNKANQKSKLHYISPKLTEFARHFELIHFTSSDKFDLNQEELKEKDSMWRILVNSDIEAHDLIINKLQEQKELIVEARSGFKPQKNMISLGSPKWKNLIEPSDFSQYIQKTADLKRFNWNQSLERRREDSVFNSSRIVLAVRPLKIDNYLVRGLFLEDEVIYKHNITAVKIRDRQEYAKNYLPYLAIFNSKTIGYMLFQLSSQWGKGEGKRDTLRNIDIERLPIKKIPNRELENRMTLLVQAIQNKKSNGEGCQKEIDELDEIIFDLYCLVEYEKEIIREFYEVRVKRSGKQESKATPSDITNYWSAFKKTYSLLLAKDKTINGTYHISKNLGAVICVSINNKLEEETLKKDTKLDILNLVKSKQLASSESLRILFEEKVKVYNKEEGKFYIIKSNQFKDWTVRQAIKDAKEEIDAFIKYLPTT
ncbi:N-6 DNA methylase [uncultured Roseivirga sp.]|uniref:HsdM family class I SAM-dependent methyltransferase n=1 Tax=uncultured Roseivirga sp. TaxID=543088 RepID=UPI000D7AC2C9|nr:N-6 DNA methylase [uncultured Roseivirga sp.]PWL29335.1 MAG: hypothetical protein DCO95_12940 [Roseivirga sp. XM-24bin3]